MKELRKKHRGLSSGHKVNHEKRNSGNSGKEELVPPSQIQNIVSKAKKDHAADRKKGREELGKLKG